MMIKLVIFDFDGVIVNTEDIFLEKLYQILKEYNLNIPFKEYYNIFVGNDTITSLCKVLNKYNLDYSIDEVYKKLSHIKNNIMRDIKKMPYIDDLLNNLTIPYCIASNSSSESISYTLDTIGLHKFFNKNTIFSAVSIGKFKPDPAVYLEALHKMGFKAEDAIAIEDSIPGVTAASNAGIKTIGFISSIHTSKDEHAEKLKQKGAFTIINSLKEVPNLINPNK